MTLQICCVAVEIKGTLIKWPLYNLKLSDSAITAAEVRWRLSQWRGKGERETEQREEREKGGGGN